MSGTSGKTACMAARAAALGTAGALLLAACGNDAEADVTGAPTSVAPEDKVAISLAVWGGFGLDSLVADYETDHPGVLIDLQTGDYNSLHEELQREIVAGAGAPTITAIGEDYMAQFAAQPEEFVDLGTLGAGDLEANYLPWKWAQGSTADGKVIGLGGDVSGLALCYRADLLEAAGLDASREAVNEAIGDSWAGFVSLGKEYVAGSDGAAFIDDASSILPPARQQAGAAYYDATGTLAVGPVEGAFDAAVDAVEAGLSAGITPFSGEWEAALAGDQFAVTLCPVWMMGFIEGTLTGTETGARWDVADLPGKGGSWGGSFYAIPAQASEEQQAVAWEFLTWLLDPAQQKRIFEATGSLPAQPALYTEDPIASYSLDFFNGAPVGQILAGSVTELPVAPSYGAKNATVEATLRAVIAEVEQGNVPAADAWAVAQEAATEADKQG